MRKITASKMNKKANLIATAMEQEAEEILLDPERAVKASCSVKDHAKALTRLESLLAAEGIEACFDKRVSRTAMKKTAEEDELLSRPEVETLVKNVVDAVVDEFEDSLKEADKVCEDELKKEFKDEENDVDSIQEVESALKKTIENRLANIGIHAKLSRNHRVKKTVKSNKGAAKRTAGKR